MLELRLAEHTAREWVVTLTGAAVPADEVADVSKLLRDEQLDALGFWLATPVVSNTDGGPTTVRLPSLPVRVGPARMPLRLPPPALGEEEKALAPSLPVSAGPVSAGPVSAGQRYLSSSPSQDHLGTGKFAGTCAPCGEYDITSLTAHSM